MIDDRQRTLYQFAFFVPLIYPDHQYSGCNTKLTVDYAVYRKYCVTKKRKWCTAHCRPYIIVNFLKQFIMGLWAQNTQFFDIFHQKLTILLSETFGI